MHAVDEVLQLARRLDRGLALLVRQRLDDLVLALGDDVETRADELGPFLGVRPRPLREGAGRRLDGQVDGTGVAGRNSLVDALRSGVDDLELVRRGRVGLLASDQHRHHGVSSLTVSSSR